MRVISMTATFGKLDGDTLRLQPGLNVITAPNEWGKSTWCAFLTAMLYGVETRERTTKGQLAEKEKYQSWSGKPMEGELRLEHEGVDITIQRRTRGRVPLGEFRAFETETGLPVPGLTGENCGQTLLGVEKSVFRRTGWIRLSDLPVTPDEAMWQRLNALATTGDESGEAALLGKKLRELKSKCRNSRGGLIPECQKTIGVYQAQLADRQSLSQRMESLRQQIYETEQELEVLERHRKVCLYRDAQANQEQTQALKQAARDARDAWEELEEQCRTVPLPRELSARLEQIEERMESLRQPVEEQQGASSLGVFAVLAVVSLGTAFVGVARGFWPVAAVAMALALGFGLLAWKAGQHHVQQTTQFRQEASRRAQEYQALQRQAEELERQKSLREELERARRTAEQTRIQLQSVIAMARKGAEAQQKDDLDLSLEETHQAVEEQTRNLKQLQLRLGQCQGRAEHLGQEEELERCVAAEQRRLRELEAQERALDLALSTLQEAQMTLQRRFAPRLTALAETYLSRLTGGKYSHLVLGEDLSLEASRLGETTLRTPAWRSDGTVDQMYLALRLAVWQTLNPQGILVLDDAFVRMDDTRLGYAMELMKQLGQSHQILLFSCQNREKELLQGASR